MEKKQFILRGKKDLIFTRERENYIMYDPIFLEYSEINDMGAEILYCISKKFSLEMIIEDLLGEYEIEKKDCQEAILYFLDTFPLKKLIYPALIQSDLYLYLSPFSEEKMVPQI